MPRIPALRVDSGEMSLFSDSVASSPKFPRQSSSARGQEDSESIVEKETRRKARHLKPVWIVLLLLIPCLALTLYYARYGLTGPVQPDSVVPSPSYALVLFLVYLDSVCCPVMVLVLTNKDWPCFSRRLNNGSAVFISPTDAQ